MTRTPDEMSRQAWAYVDECLDSGRITLPKGGGPQRDLPQAVAPDKDDPTCRLMLDTCKWLGQLQGKPKKTPKAMDNWIPPETK
mgnify:CR=1 FL=1